jgi:hypothetical protein
MGGRLVACLLGLGLGGGRPPPAAPAAAAAACLMRVTTAAKIQHQERDRGRPADAAAPRLSDQAACDGDMPPHAALPPLGPWSPRARWRRWRARSTARSSSAAAGSWRRRFRAKWAAARWHDWQ